MPSFLPECLRRVRRHTTYQSGDFADHQARGVPSACDLFGEAAVGDLFAFNTLGSQAVDGTAVAPKRVVVLVTPRLGFDSRAHKGVLSRLGNGQIGVLEPSGWFLAFVVGQNERHCPFVFGHIESLWHELVSVVAVARPVDTRAAACGYSGGPTFYQDSDSMNLAEAKIISRRCRLPQARRQRGARSINHT